MIKKPFFSALPFRIGYNENDELTNFGISAGGGGEGGRVEREVATSFRRRSIAEGRQVGRNTGGLNISFEIPLCATNVCNTRYDSKGWGGKGKLNSSLFSSLPFIFARIYYISIAWIFVS